MGREGDGTNQNLSTICVHCRLFKEMEASVSCEKITPGLGVTGRRKRIAVLFTASVKGTADAWKR